MPCQIPETRVSLGCLQPPKGYNSVPKSLLIIEQLYQHIYYLWGRHIAKR